MVEQHIKGAGDQQPQEKQVQAADEIDLTRLYCFGNLESIVEAAHVLKNYYHGENRLYKNVARKLYYLVLSKSSHTPEEFNKVCNILTEYGSNEPYKKSTEAYMSEHYDLVIKKDALQKLINA